MDKRFVLMLVFFCVLCGSSFADINPKLVLVNYSVSEDPALPGHAVILTVQYVNIGYSSTACASQVQVQVVTSYPLSVNGSDSQYVSSLCNGDPASQGTFSFILPVDPLAQTGTYPVSVLSTYEKDYQTFSTSNSLGIRVNGPPSFEASVTSSVPVDIYPGDTATVGVTFQNTGSSTVESAQTSMVASDGIEVKWSGQNRNLGQIQAHSSASTTFEIEADKNMTPGNYTLNVTLNYIGENSTPGVQEFSFQIPIKQQAQFVASGDQNPSLLASQDDLVTIAITNTGTQEAKKLKISLLPVFPFSTDGTVRYIDSLQPGEQVNLTYTIHVDKDATAGQQISSVLINYEDPQGNKLSDTEDFSLNVQTLTLYQIVIAYWYVIVIVVLVIAFIILRKIFRFLLKHWKATMK